ncbi:hypothetical protein Unana1_00735 [Umbelopsis nana]
MSLQAGQKRGFEPNNEAESIKTDQVDNNTNVPHNGLSTAGAATNDEANGDSEDQVLKRAKLSNTDNSTVPHHEPSAMIADEFKRASAGIENAAKHGFDEAAATAGPPPSYVPATLAALPRSAVSPPGRHNIPNNRNYEPSAAGMRMSVSAILSKSGKEEMYRSKPTVDDQGSRGQSLPPIGQTPTPPSPYTTFHSRSSSHPLIEENQLPRKLSHPTFDKIPSPADTKHRLVHGLLASAPADLPPPTSSSPNPVGSTMSTTSQAVAASATPTTAAAVNTSSNLGQILSPNNQPGRRASLGNLMSSHSPLLQQSYRRNSLDSGAAPPASSPKPSVKEEEPEEEQGDVPLRKPKLIIKNDLVWKSLEGKPEKSLGVFVYEPGVQLPILEGQENATLEMRIPSWWLTYDNKMVKKRALWGTDIYTDDTDIVSMILHSGKYEASYQEPQVKLNNDVLLAMSGTAAVIEPRRVDIDQNIPDHDVSVTLRVLPKLLRYAGTIRHHLKSREWGGNHDGMSLYVEKVDKLPRGEARSKGRGALKRGLFAFQDLRRRAITKEKEGLTSDGVEEEERGDNSNHHHDMNRNRGVRKKIKMFQVS